MKKEKIISINFTENELEHFINIVEDAADSFGNRICSDYEMENTDENWNIILKYREYNKDSLDNEPRPSKNKKIFFYDFCMMHLLKAKLEKEIT